MVAKIRAFLLLTAINAVLLVSLFEAAAIATYRAETGAWFYGAGRAKSGAMPEAFDVKAAVFHPYFSFLNRVGRSGDYGAELKDVWTTNNQGFQFARKSLADGCCDMPYTPRENEVVVGLLGGSVGGGFGIMAGVLPSFEKAVQAHPDFAGKKVRLINMAMSGYHQPQQAIVLAYYLTMGQKFDLVINIDGFNELAIPDYNIKNQAEPFYPAVQVWGAMGKELESQRLITADRRSLLAGWHRLSARAAEVEMDACAWASCWLWERGFGAVHRWRAAALGDTIKNVDQSTTMFAMKMPDPVATGAALQATDAVDSFVDGWARASQATAALANAGGAMYLHILQPNQWYPAEQRYAPMDPTHPYGTIVELIKVGYPKLVERLRKLQSQGIHTFDATRIYLGLDNRDIFIDDCCHYTQQGYDVLFNALAENIPQLKRPSRQ